MTDESYVPGENSKDVPELFFYSIIRRSIQTLYRVILPSKSEEGKKLLPSEVLHVYRWKYRNTKERRKRKVLEKFRKVRIYLPKFSNLLKFYSMKYPEIFCCRSKNATFISLLLSCKFILLRKVWWVKFYFLCFFEGAKKNRSNVNKVIPIL